MIVLIEYLDDWDDLDYWDDWMIGLIESNMQVMILTIKTPRPSSLLKVKGRQAESTGRCTWIPFDNFHHHLLF